MKKIKKTLSAMLSCALVFSLMAGLAVSAGAEGYTATETMTDLYNSTESAESGNYISIKDADEFAYFAEYVNNGYVTEGVTFYLTSDVALSGTWTPIGAVTITSNSTTSSPEATGTGFAGTFDGQGHNIEGLDVQGTSSAQGLFAYVTATGTIEDFNLYGSVKVTTSSDAIAGVVGYNSGTVYKVINYATVTANKGYNVGGIAGFNNGYYNDGQGVISCCGNEGSISGYSKTGGIAGENSGTIDQCYNYPTIYNASGAKSGTGGIAGRNGNNNTAVETGVIENCYNRGYVNNNNGYWGGGIVGFQNSLSSVNNVYDTGDVYHCSWSNPIVGQNEGTVEHAYSKGGLYTSSSEGELDYYSAVGTILGLTAMQTQGFATELNENIGETSMIWDWSSNLNSGLPYLSWQGTDFSDSNATDDITGGANTEPNWGYTTDSIILDGNFEGNWVTSTESSNIGFDSLAEAIVAAYLYGTDTIFVTGSNTISDTETIPEDITIIRDLSYTDGYLFEVKGTLNLYGIIDGQGIAANAQIILEGGTLNMYDNSAITDAVALYRTGAGVRINGGTFNMYGGSITNVEATEFNNKVRAEATAVTIDVGVFNMQNGEICTGYSDKPAIYVGLGQTFILGEGYICPDDYVYLYNTEEENTYITITDLLVGQLTVQCNYESSGVLIAQIPADDEFLVSISDNMRSYNSAYYIQIQFVPDSDYWLVELGSDSEV